MCWILSKNFGILKSNISQNWVHTHEMWWSGPWFCLLLLSPTSQKDQEGSERWTLSSLEGSLSMAGLLGAVDGCGWVWVLFSTLPPCFVFPLYPASHQLLLAPDSSCFCLYPTLNSYKTPDKPMLKTNKVQVPFEKTVGGTLFFEMTLVFPLPLNGQQSLFHVCSPLGTPHPAGRGLCSGPPTVIPGQFTVSPFSLHHLHGEFFQSLHLIFTKIGLIKCHTISYVSDICKIE